MKREELPGFVRELPITILTILIYALILASVFWPLYSRYYRKKAEENRTRDAQETTVPVESPEDDSAEPGSDGDAGRLSD